jgi:hypothetical protein
LRPVGDSLEGRGGKGRGKESRGGGSLLILLLDMVFSGEASAPVLGSVAFLKRGKGARLMAMEGVQEMPLAQNCVLLGSLPLKLRC